MSAPVPRLRMFAGPNGSGKSTILSLVPEPLLGVVVNADEIEKELARTGALDLGALGIHVTQDEAAAFFRASALLDRAGLLGAAEAICVNGDRLSFEGVPVNSYLASVAADLVRRRLLAARVPFTFETVMSSPDKVDFLAEAQAAGYRTYLYYVATEAPEINVSRVEARVAQGGHDVPPDKVVARYARSLGLLLDAVRHTDRAYIFDNSGAASVWLAEVTGGTDLEMKAGQMPGWFRTHVWDRMAPAEPSDG